MNSLLQKALAIPRPYKRYREVTHEELEIALAYTEGDITAQQLAKVLNKNPSNALVWAATRLMRGYQKGYLIRNPEKPLDGRSRRRR